MKKNMKLYAEGKATNAIANYKNENRRWMDEVDEDAIYREIASSEFRLYQEMVLGL